LPTDARLRYGLAMASPRCWQCKSPLDLVPLRPVGRTESCPECDADIRSCRGCAYFDATLGLCGEPTAEPPADKDRANFCSAYRLAPPPEVDATHLANSPQSAKRRLEDLFKK